MLAAVERLRQTPLQRLREDTGYTVSVSEQSLGDAVSAALLPCCLLERRALRVAAPVAPDVGPLARGGSSAGGAARGDATIPDTLQRRCSPGDESPRLALRRPRADPRQSPAPHQGRNSENYNPARTTPSRHRHVSRDSDRHVDGSRSESPPEGAAGALSRRPSGPRASPRPPASASHGGSPQPSRKRQAAASGTHAWAEEMSCPAQAPAPAARRSVFSRIKLRRREEADRLTTSVRVVTFTGVEQLYAAGSRGSR